MTALEMNPEIRARWTAALRSGEYPQARNFLRAKGGFCCYGVLCELAAADGVIAPAADIGGSYHYDGVADYLPARVQRWAGITGFDPEVEYEGYDEHLSDLNDEGHDFAEIADLIDGTAEAA